MSGDRVDAAAWTPCAVSLRSVDLLTAPPTSARVVGVMRAAVYLCLEEDGSPVRRPEADAHSRRVIPLLTDSAVLLPSGIRVGSLSWPSSLTVGDDVRVGENRVLLAGLDLRVVRTWRPPRVRVGAPRPMPDLIGRVDPGLRQAAATLVKTAMSGADPGALVRALVGQGQGLTPTGDDLLCGVLLALRAAASAESWADPLRAQIAGRWAATTSLSAMLLRDAADGYAVPAVARLVDHLFGGATERASFGLVAQVLGIGHTSGADLLAGVLGTGDALHNTAPWATSIVHHETKSTALTSKGAF